MTFSISSRMKGILILSIALAVILQYPWPAHAASHKDGGKAIMIRGRVLSVDGPVAGARVRIPGQSGFVLTDKLGRYELKWPAIERERFALNNPQQKPLVVTAGKEGYFNNAAAVGRSGLAGDIFLNPVYLASQPDYKFNSPQTCYRCHTKLTLLWNKSKMAHATSNPKLFELYYGEDFKGNPVPGPAFKKDNPNDAGDCAVCHAPSAVASHPPEYDLKKILKSPRTEWDGVSCDFCHKIRKVVEDPTSPSGFLPILEKQAPLQGPSILVFGPYDDVVAAPMGASYNPLFKTARLCAVCHSQKKNLAPKDAWNPSTVYSKQEWAGLGFNSNKILPLQTTYQEWKMWQDSLGPDDSNKGKTCQKCHLSWQKNLLPYYHYVVDDSARNMWGTYREAEDIRPHHFEGSTPAQLANSLSLEIEGKIIEQSGQKVLKLKVHVSNTNGGHWVPTGEPMRNIILTVKASDINEQPLKLLEGQLLPEWTGTDETGGRLAKKPGAVFARVLADSKGNLNVPTWKATKIAMDTRIRPKKTVTLEYVFALNADETEPSAEARLIYRPVVYTLAKEKKWDVKDVIISTKAW